MLKSITITTLFIANLTAGIHAQTLSRDSEIKKIAKADAQNFNPGAADMKKFKGHQRKNHVPFITLLVYTIDEKGNHI